MQYLIALIWHTEGEYKGTSWFQVWLEYIQLAVKKLLAIIHER